MKKMVYQGKKFLFYLIFNIYFRVKFGGSTKSPNTKFFLDLVLIPQNGFLKCFRGSHSPQIKWRLTSVVAIPAL